MTSTPNTRLASLQRSQRGQAMPEYLVIALLLTIALFIVPVSGTQQTVGQFLASRIHDLYDNVSFFLSLP
jgi:hypothetical protein